MAYIIIVGIELIPMPIADAGVLQQSHQGLIGGHTDSKKSGLLATRIGLVL